MSRGLWFVAGAGAGVYAMLRARRAAEVFTAEGLRDRVSGLSLGARMLREEVAQGRAEKESELRERFGLVPHGRPELEDGRHRASPLTAGAAPTPTPSTSSGTSAPTQEGSN